MQDLLMTACRLAADPLLVATHGLIRFMKRREVRADYSVTVPLP